MILDVSQRLHAKTVQIASFPCISMFRMHNGHKKQPNSLRDLFFLIIYVKIEWPLKKGHFDLLCKLLMLTYTDGPNHKIM